MARWSIFEQRRGPLDWRASEERDMASVGRKASTGESIESNDANSASARMADAAEALIPQLRARAARTEEMRRIPPETEHDLHDAGLFRILQPKRVGGAELDY